MLMRDLGVASPGEDLRGRRCDHTLFTRNGGGLTRHVICIETSVAKIDLPIHVNHAGGDYDRRCRSHCIANRIADRERDRIFLEFSAMRQQPVAAKPVKDNRTQEKEELWR